MDKTKMAEVKEWLADRKDMVAATRNAGGITNIEFSFCPGEGWLAARYVRRQARVPRTRPQRWSIESHGTLTRAGDAPRTAAVRAWLLIMTAWSPARPLPPARYIFDDLDDMIAFPDTEASLSVPHVRHLFPVIRTHPVVVHQVALLARLFSAPRAPRRASVAVCPGVGCTRTAADLS